ncbi:SitI3 family protein [Actinoplanes sp. TRM 88003]|uniref:SitI3 family protein n=1 Tax=Paractinoplanes aksuensis TaxID=2939490 RepID=A0ABT1DQB5_9ACTN|nr:SitI3 family protein [Actinoplanes aksuensis]MCO8273020.1 SitI3 family protein [Actinoplanes aksuensis]
MAIEYDLILAGDTPAEQVAARAFPEHDERPDGPGPLLVAVVNERYGFAATIRSGGSRYVEVLTDQGSWEWEPEPAASVGFRMDKEVPDVAWQVTNMLTVVRRVLATGAEDAAFSFNGDILLLSRLNGVLTKHRRDKWWANYPGANDALPG